MKILIPIAFFLFCVFMIFQTSKNHEKKYMFQKQEEHKLKQQIILSSISQSVRIINDCRNIIGNSTNLETVQYRYELAIKEIIKLKDFIDQLAPSDISRQLKKDVRDLHLYFIDGKYSLIKQAIYNAFQAEIIAISKLKTASGKIKRQNKFYERICSIFPEQESYIRDLIGYDIFGR